MDLDAWYDHARRDAAEQGDRALVPLLDMLQRATRALRAADWAQDAPDDAERGAPGHAEGGAPERPGGRRAPERPGGRRAPERRPPAAAPDRSSDRIR